MDSCVGAGSTPAPAARWRPHTTISNSVTKELPKQASVNSLTFAGVCLLSAFYLVLSVSSSADISLQPTLQQVSVRKKEKNRTILLTV